MRHRVFEKHSVSFLSHSVQKRQALDSTGAARVATISNIRYNTITETEAMTLLISTEPVPLTTDAEGVVRVGKTRVTLDTVIGAFLDGATAEEITYQYPSLDLADAYAVIAYYLRRPSEIEAYLQQRKQHAQAIRKQNEARFDPQGVRGRLMARRTGA